MGFSSDIMNDFVSKEIKSVYSSYDGWKMTQRNLGSGYDTIATLERRNGGHRDICQSPRYLCKTSIARNA